MVAKRNTSEYFKERRKTIGQFSVSVTREKLDALDKKLKEKGQTKTAWLNEKIDEEIGNKRKSGNCHDYQSKSVTAPPKVVCKL